MNKAAQQLGRKGGKARAKAMTAKERSDSARKAARVRLRAMSAQQRSDAARRAVQARWAKAKKERK
jgi:hypothetical protein